MYLKVSFVTVTEMTKVKQAVMPSIRKNREREKSNTFYNEMLAESLASRSDTGAVKKVTDHLENILDIRFVFFALNLNSFNFVNRMS